MPPNNQSNAASAIPVYVVGDPYPQTPVGYEQITGLTSAKHLTPPVGATTAVISVSGAPVRWRDDGVAPTATVGMPQAIGTMIYNASLSAIQFIQQSATATLDVNYYS